MQSLHSHLADVCMVGPLHLISLRFITDFGPCVSAAAICRLTADECERRPIVDAFYHADFQNKPDVHTDAQHVLAHAVPAVCAQVQGGHSPGSSSSSARLPEAHAHSEILRKWNPASGTLNDI